MDFEQNNNQSGSSEQHGFSSISGPAQQKPKKSSGWKIFWGIFIVLSVMTNILLFILLIFVGMAAALGAGTRGHFIEQVIQEGPRTRKISVINLTGIINDEQSANIYQQLKEARIDGNIRGLIIRVNSPGGMVSSSDQIYNEIRKYRSETEKPVVAFMQGIAASGGYYASVACDKIVAEPTTITGSVGVIMGYFVLQELLENKLGIQPVIVKSGLKKDWPSSFRKPEDEELQYLEDTLIKPAYERFVNIVAEGRSSLTLDEVKRLADGSIYSVQQALDEKLIDKIGYMDDAIDEVKDLAGIKNKKALVVEYKRQFSFYDFLDSRAANYLKIDRAKLYEFSTPQILYLWSGFH